MVSAVASLSLDTAEHDENDENIGAEMEEEDEERGVSEYEQTREKRIKENMERMKKLGILDMSQELKSTVLGRKAGRKRKALDFKSTAMREADVLPRPTRRSSRLQNASPVSYAEVGVERKGNSTRSHEIYLEVGSKPEVYTEEHDKLLGECNMSWTLFVDGYGKDGKRIYDPVKGKTCHQCRQKTLGHRTTCCNCNMVQGQFCGDCLYMRYGEHVLEANRNPDWVCPPCRGICNCSLCRQAKGWAPTGPLYRKIASLGYKSVAHYLFQTRRSQTDDGNDPTKTLSKRALPVADDAPSVKDNLAKFIAQHSESDNGRNESENKEKIDAGMNAEDGHRAEQFGIDLNSGDDDNAHNTEVKTNAPEDGVASDHSALEVADCNKQVNPTMHVGENGLRMEHMGTDMGTQIAAKISKTNVGKNTDELQHIKGMLGQESLDYIKTPDKTSIRKKNRVLVSPSPDSIAGRLRLRRNGHFSFQSA